MVKKSWILDFDLFGKRIAFLVNEREKFNTVLGTILSFIVLIISGLFIVCFGLKLVNRENLRVIIADYADRNPERMNLSSKDFVLTIGLQYPNFTLYADEEVYTINANLITVKKDEKFEIRPLKISNCLNYQSKTILEYFPLVNLNALYCLDVDESDLYLEGSFGNEVWTYLSFDFFECKNETEGSHCKSEEQIREILSEGYVGIFTSDHSVQPKHFLNPIQKFGKNIYSSFSRDIFMDLWIHIKEVNVITDKGFLFNSYVKEKTYSYDGKDFGELGNEKENNFLKVNFQLSNTKTVYERSYEKFQDFTAVAGGVIQFTLIMGKLVTFLFKEVLFRNFIYSSQIPWADRESIRMETIKNRTGASKFQQNQTLNKESFLEKKGLIEEKAKAGSTIKTFNNSITQNFWGSKRKDKISYGSVILLLCDQRVKKRICRAFTYYDTIKTLLDIKTFLFLQQDINNIKRKIYGNDKTIPQKHLSHLYLNSTDCWLSKFSMKNF